MFMSGPELPIARYAHTMVNLQNDITLVIGGYTPVNPTHLAFPECCNKVSIFCHKKLEWLEGPNLIQGRLIHAVGVVTDVSTWEKLIIVTGGRGPSKE